MTFPGMDMILPPQNKEAEEATVGSGILNPSSLDTIGYLLDEDFYFQTPRIIWKAIQKLRQDNTAVDYMTVSDMLERMGDLEGIGGPAALASIINAVPSFNTEAYAKIVKEMSQRRGILESAQHLAKIAYDLEHPIADPVGDVLDGLVNNASAPEKGATHLSVGLSQLVDYVNARRLNPAKVWGIPTGFIDIDEFTGGQHLGLVTYIAGPPGAGKTKLALQMGIQAALPENHSNPVAIYSLEMPDIEIVKRIVSGRTDVTTYEMNTGKMDDIKYGKFLGNIEMLERLPVYICDHSLSLTELHADLARLKKNFGVKLFILDYLMLIQGYEGMDETPRSALLSRGIKGIARNLNLAGITVASTTKENMLTGSEPTMRDMRGSAQVIFDADGIMFLQPSLQPGMQNIAQIHWVKMPRTVNRSSGPGVIELVIDSTYPIFRDAVRTVNLNNIG